MTSRLEAAFQAAAQLPPAEQDALAEVILAEVGAEGAAGDREWDARFQHSQGALASLADEALAELRTGRAEPLDRRKL